MTVYVTQDAVRKNGNGELIPAFDLAPATVFGELYTLFPRGRDISLNSHHITAVLKHKLRNFTDRDYILPVGDPVLFMATAMVAGQMNNGKVKVLKWDRDIRAYMQVVLEV